MNSQPAAGGDGGWGGALGLELATQSQTTSNRPAMMRASVAQRHVQRMRQSLATMAAPELSGGSTVTPGEAADYMLHIRQSLARDDGPLPPPPAAKPESGGTGPTLSFVRKTTKYWVQICDMAEVKRLVGENLPLYQFNADLEGDSQLCNSVYLDNQNRDLYQQRMDKVPGALALRLRWYDVGEPDTVFVERKTHRESWCGEVSVKERFALHADDVVPFFRGEHTAEDVAAVMRKQGKGAAEINSMHTLFSEVYEKIESMQLEPSVRTQYYRAAWQSDSSAAVRISLDHNLFMITENPKCQSVSTLESGRWFRDPFATVGPDELTWFPHGVLEVKLALPEGEDPPLWVQELLDSGLVHEVNKFSKFLHGTATLMPHTVEHAPYWFDDASIRPSIIATRAAVASGLAAQTKQSSMEDFGEELTNTTSVLTFSLRSGARRNPSRSENKRSSMLQTLVSPDDALGSQSDSAYEGEHPFQPGLGDGPQLLHAQRMQRQGCLGECAGDYTQYCCWGGHSAKTLRRKRPVKVEPKVFFANERTFMSWLHMSVLTGSIGAAMLGLVHGPDAGDAAPRAANTVVVRHVGDHAEDIGKVMVLVGILMGVYALITFYWRSRKIRLRLGGSFADNIGPALLCITLMGGFLSSYSTYAAKQ